MVQGEDLVASAPRAYRVVGVVGQGGFGTVYRAELVGPGGFVRKVALKVLNPEFEADRELGQRLRDEARMLALVRHRAIVGVDELTLLDGRWAVVMELVEGSDLRKLLDALGGPLPVGAALEVAAEVASALAVAHSATGPDGLPLGLLHRDLKPSNLLLTPHGEVKIVDFGVARGQFAGREASTREFAFGSPGYMPPERTELIECPEGDVYSLGVVLFELLTGRRFGRAQLNPRKHARQVEQALQQAREEGVPPAVCDLVGEMLSFEVLSRPSASDVERRARQLRSTLEGPWLRDFAPGAIAAMGQSSHASEDSGRVTLATSAREPVEPTLRAETVWEEVDTGQTRASAIPPMPSLPPRTPTPRSRQASPPRLPPARPTEPSSPPLAPLEPLPQGLWPRSWSDMPTVLVDEAPADAQGAPLRRRLAWAALALSPVPLLGALLLLGGLAAWMAWGG